MLTVRTILRHTTTRYNTLQHTAIHRTCHRGHAILTVRTSLQHTATHGNALQYTATYCSIPQHTARHCKTLHRQTDTATHCNALQYTATDCNTLQHTATHYHTLYHCFRNNMSKETYKLEKRPITAPHCMPCIQSAPVKSCHAYTESCHAHIESCHAYIESCHAWSVDEGVMSHYILTRSDEHLVFAHVWIRSHICEVVLCTCVD